jgi:quinol monooxygenase YgiN
MADQVQALLATMPSPSRAEVGCLNYDLHQSLDAPTLFIIYENWVDRAALEAHFQTPHFLALIAALDGMLTAPIAVTQLVRLEASPAHQKGA